MAYVKALHAPQLSTCFTGDATSGLSAQAGATLGLTNVIRCLTAGVLRRRPVIPRTATFHNKDEATSARQTLGGQSMVAEHW